jgi:hypothetical protein
VRDPVRTLGRLRCSLSPRGRLTASAAKCGRVVSYGGEIAGPASAGPCCVGRAMPRSGVLFRIIGSEHWGRVMF